MAFEEIWAPFAVMFILAVFLFPAMYLLDMIKQRLDPESKGRKILLIFGMSFLTAMVFYPFAIPEESLPFNSSNITYILTLLVVFLVYLITFNKTKE